MTDKGVLEKAKIKPAQGSHMVDGRTYRNAANVPLTTNNIEPQRPNYPAVRKPAAGPLITTENVDPKKTTGDILREDDMAYAAKSAEKIDADFKADVKEKKGKK